MLSLQRTVCALVATVARPFEPVLLFGGFQRTDLHSSSIGVAISRIAICGERPSLFERREGEPLNLKQLWSAALGEIQLNLSKGNYDTWFKDTAIVSEEDDVFMIGVPNAFAREWLENKYRTQVRETLQRLLSRTVDVRFVNMTAASARSDGGPKLKARLSRRFTWAEPGPRP